MRSAPLLFVTTAVVFATACLVCCTSFGTGATTADAGPVAADASDDAANLKEECARAFLCERFDDDDITSRGWTRDNAQVTDAKVFRSSIAAGSSAVSEITHPINSARTDPNRIRIALTLQILEGRNRNVDIINYRRANGETTGVFLAANGDNGSLEFGSYEASSNSLRSQSIDINFEKPTRIEIVIDYERNEARLSADGMSTPRAFPLPRGLPSTRDASLLLGYSYIDNESPLDQQHVLEMDDVILSDQ